MKYKICVIHVALDTYLLLGARVVMFSGPS